MPDDRLVSNVWAVMDEPGVELYHVLLTIRVHKEDGQYAAVCEELGVPSCSHTLDEAIRNVLDATIDT